MKKKKLLYTILVIVILLIAVIIIQPFSNSAKQTETLKDRADQLSKKDEIEFSVDAAVVRKGTLVKWINTNGYAHPYNEYSIKPKISAQVTSLNAYNGERVKKNDLLVKLEDDQYQLKVNQAKSDLIKAQIEYELQKSSPVEDNGGLKEYQHRYDSLKVIYGKAKKLYQENKMSYEDFNRLERDFETLKTIATLRREDVVANRSGLTNAATNYKEAELNLSHTKIVSPINGLVSDCVVSEGGYVTVGNECLKVIDISKIKMQCEVTESDIVNINPGDEVTANFIALPDKNFKGKVIEVNPSIDLTKRTALVTVLLTNPNLLIKPGMFASVKIGTKSFINQIIIPHSSLLVRENRSLVFTVENGLALWKYVKVGEKNEDFYAIKSGINVGDTLIVDNNYNLAHQSTVKIARMEKY